MVEFVGINECFGNEIFEPPAGELFTLGCGTFFSCGQIEFWLPSL